MDDFDPKHWTATFEALGGVASLAPHGGIWLGVVRARPDGGQAALALRDDLQARPDQLDALAAYVRARSGAAPRRHTP